MGERFPLKDIPAVVSDIAMGLRRAGHDAWYVGGAVRDTLLSLAGRTTHDARDFDIATSARPEEVQALFKRTVPVGIEHGTVAVLDNKNVGHEVTTYRRDVKTDGRHAEVEFGVSLEDDLARRDFTINAIAVHPESGELRDPFGGQADLASGVVRAVGDAAARFREDRLRVLRALRFAATFGFDIEPATLAALRASVGELGHLSRERVRDEWFKMLGRAKPSVAIGLWRENAVIGEVWPGLRAVPDGGLAALDASGSHDPVLLTAGALLHAGATPDEAEKAAEGLKGSSRDSARIKAIVAAGRAPVPAAHERAAVRRWLARHLSVALDSLSIALPSPGRDALRGAAQEELEAGVPLAIGDLAVTGDDLKAAGLPAGPQMGETLRRLLEVVLDDPSLNTRDALLARAKPVPGS